MLLVLLWERPGTTLTVRPLIDLHRINFPLALPVVEFVVLVDYPYLRRVMFAEAALWYCRTAQMIAEVV